MLTFVLVVHTLIALALVAVILLQKSEGGGLGIGGGTGGGLMTARGAANLLTTSTAWLAAAFVGTSIVLAFLAGATQRNKPLDTSLAKSAPTAPAPAGAPLLPGLSGGAPVSAPATPAPATPPGSAPSSAPADGVPLAR